MADSTKLLVSETLAMLQHQLSQAQPCVAQASMVLGCLQDRLFHNSAEPLQASVSQYMYRFKELFVDPAATKLTKCKTPQDKVVAIAKFLRGKLAKAPAHKQPLHTQYLPSALRDSGKRQLDCLGIATAVLALCHHIAAKQQQHAHLAAAAMVVSDDHCWLSVPAEVLTAADASCDQEQQQLVYVEVTDPGVLSPGQLSGSWLYAGGHGTSCSPAQMLMVLVAGLMPEELQDDSAAGQLREVQLSLLHTLAQAHPEALLYSNFFRWGMLHEEAELEQLAAAAQTASDSGSMAGLQALALLPPAQLQSQQCFATAMHRSNGWQWHPSSCAAFGWLNRIQALLCGETDDWVPCLRPQQQLLHGDTNSQVVLPGNSTVGTVSAGGTVGTVKPWLDVTLYLLQQALEAVSGCTAVLRRYSGCAGKPNKAADTQLLEAVRDLWQNLADASKAVAYLQQLELQHTSMVSLQQQQQQQEGVPQVQPVPQQQQQTILPQSSADVAGGADTAARASSPGGHVCSDVPAAAAVPSHTVHLAAAVKRAASALDAQHGTAHTTALQGVLTEPSWLRIQLEFLDALLCFFGVESADVPAGAVSDFIAVAGTYSSSARQQAVADAVAQTAVHSSRVQGLIGSSTWVGLEPGLQQLLQMPGSRSRKKHRKD